MNRLIALSAQGLSKIGVIFILAAAISWWL